MRPLPAGSPLHLLVFAGSAALLCACGDVVCDPGSASCLAGAAGGDGAPACDAHWAKGFIATKSAQGTTMAVDAQDNVYVAGTFGGTLDLGNGPLVDASGFPTLFVAKLDCTGAALWSRAFAYQEVEVEAAGPFPLSIAASGDGQVVVTGLFGGTLDLGTGPLTSQAINGFVVALDASGATRWARIFGTYGELGTGTGVAYDASGDVYLAGMTGGTTDFGAGPLGNDGAVHLFLAKLDAQGNALFSKSFGTTTPVQTYSVAVDSRGRVVLCGDARGAYDFGGGPLTPGQGLYCAKLTAGGDHVWTRGLTATSGYMTGLALDPSDRVLLAGGAASADLAGTSIAASTPGTNEGFLLALGSDGEPAFVRAFGAGAAVAGVAVAAGADGGAEVAGSFQGGPLDVGLGPMVSAGALDGFIASFDASGTPTSGERFGDAQGQRINAIHTAPGGSRVICGTYEGDVTIAGAAAPHASRDSVLVARIAP